MKKFNCNNFTPYVKKKNLNNNILIYGQKVHKVENDGTKIEKFGI